MSEENKEEQLQFDFDYTKVVTEPNYSVALNPIPESTPGIHPVIGSTESKLLTPAFIYEERIDDLQDVTDIQSSDGNWNHDPYMHGMANGMILALAILKGDNPEFFDAPKEWLDKNLECPFPSNDEPIACIEPEEVECEKCASCSCPNSPTYYPY